MTISDQTWAQLDPGAGRLTPDDRRTLRRVLGGLLVAVLVAGAVWWTGLLVPRVGVDDASGSSWGDRTFSRTVRVTSAAPLSFDLVGAGRSGPGLELQRVEGLPAFLGDGASAEITLHYRVTDCDAVPAEAWPVPVRTTGFTGTRTTWLDLPTSTSDDAPGSYSYAGEDPYAVQWQRYLADQACGRGAPVDGDVDDDDA